MTLNEIYKQAVAKHGKEATDKLLVDTLTAFMRPKKGLSEACALVIADLNKRSTAAYRPTAKDTKRLIQARMADGATLEDFYRVNEVMCRAWLGTDQQDYLRPKTLYAAGNFESYLAKWQRAQPKPKPAPAKPVSNTAKSPKKPPVELKPWYQYTSFDELSKTMWCIEDATTYNAYPCPTRLRTYQRNYISLQLNKSEYKRARSMFDQLKAEELAKRGLK